MYKIHTLLKRGSNHSEYCEDFIFYTHVKDDFFIAAVFDGCSSGKDSHFASALFGKIFKKICTPSISDFTSVAESLNNLFWNFCVELKSIRESLNLDMDEILSTINCMLLDKKNKEGMIVCFGDGYYRIDDTYTEIDQNNTPDYIAYHIDEWNTKQEFNKWFEKNKNKLHFRNRRNIFISTDGIFSFVEKNIEPDSPDKPIITDFLANDSWLITNPSMLDRKYNILKNKHLLDNYDDIACIRITDL